MGDLDRCWIILGVEPGSSRETVKWAYRNLVKAWHPDQFSHDPVQQHEVQERLKEANWAYDYLETHVFIEAAPAENHETTASETEPEPEKTAPERTPSASEPVASERGGFWQAIVFVIVAVLGGTLVYYVWPSSKDSDRYGPRKTMAEVPITKPRPAAPVTPPPPAAATVPANPKNILARMIPANSATVSSGADGVHLDAPGTRDYLRTPQPIRPPFTLRAQVLTDAGDVRLYYALGIVVFNWTANADELRVHDPLTGLSAGAPGQGSLSHGEWHELVWRVTTNAMQVVVDGQIRYESVGNYTRLDAYPAIGSRDGPLTIRSVELEGQPTTTGELLALKPTPPFPGNLLASMVPVNDLRVLNDPEGMTLASGTAPAPMLKYAEPLRPPFTIRVRAKTDSVDLRLYYAQGLVIFNWQDNPGELRVHDPLTNQITPLPSMGRILANDWHYIVWEVTEAGMKISVDGAIRYQNRKNYGKAEGFAGIGPHLSKLTVDSFVVERN